MCTEGGFLSLGSYSVFQVTEQIQFCLSACCFHRLSFSRFTLCSAARLAQRTAVVFNGSGIHLLHVETCSFQER